MKKIKKEIPELNCSMCDIGVKMSMGCEKRGKYHKICDCFTRDDEVGHKDKKV